MASGSWDQTIVLWDTSKAGEAKCLRTLSGSKSTVWCLAFSEDGKLATGSEGSTVILWNTRDGNEIEQERTLTGHTDEVLNIFFLKGNKYLISSNRKEILVWNRHFWDEAPYRFSMGTDHLAVHNTTLALNHGSGLYSIDLTDFPNNFRWAIATQPSSLWLQGCDVRGSKGMSLAVQSILTAEGACLDVKELNDPSTFDIDDTSYENEQLTLALADYDKTSIARLSAWTALPDASVAEMIAETEQQKVEHLCALLHKIIAIEHHPEWQTHSSTYLIASYYVASVSTDYSDFDESNNVLSSILGIVEAASERLPRNSMTLPITFLVKMHLLIARNFFLLGAKWRAKQELERAGAEFEKAVGAPPGSIITDKQVSYHNFRLSFLGSYWKIHLSNLLSVESREQLIELLCGKSELKVAFGNYFEALVWLIEAWTLKSELERTMNYLAASSMFCFLNLLSPLDYHSYKEISFSSNARKGLHPKDEKSNTDIYQATSIKEREGAPSGAISVSEGDIPSMNGAEIESRLLLTFDVDKDENPCTQTSSTSTSATYEIAKELSKKMLDTLRETYFTLSEYLKIQCHLISRDYEAALKSLMVSPKPTNHRENFYFCSLNAQVHCALSRPEVGLAWLTLAYQEDSKTFRATKLFPLLLACESNEDHPEQLTPFFPNELKSESCSEVLRTIGGSGHSGISDGTKFTLLRQDLSATTFAPISETTINDRNELTINMTEASFNSSLSDTANLSLNVGSGQLPAKKL